MLVSDTQSTLAGHPRTSDIKSPHGTDFGRRPCNTRDGGFSTSSPAYTSSYVDKSLTPTTSRIEQRDEFSPLIPDQVFVFLLYNCGKIQEVLIKYCQKESRKTSLKNYKQT